MNELTKQKIFVATGMLTVNRRCIQGESEVNSDSFVLSKALLKALDYAIKQNDLGGTGYDTKVDALEDCFCKFAQECPDVCYFKERIVHRIINKENIIPYSNLVGYA